MHELESSDIYVELKEMLKHKSLVTSKELWNRYARKNNINDTNYKNGYLVGSIRVFQMCHFMHNIQIDEPETGEFTFSYICMKKSK